MAERAYAVAVEGLDSVKFAGELSGLIATAALRAINTTADHARTSADRAIRLQVAFSASYLAPSAGRLTVTKRANSNDLSAQITGRGRPTSLARFATSGTPGKPGVTVVVKPGVARFMPRAFLMRLRRGDQDVDGSNFNLGLAVRLKPGETLRNKKEMIRISDGLYLLHGPSINQVFATVAGDIAPPEAAYLEDEFNRLMALQ